jgi:hypothetical protein
LDTKLKKLETETDNIWVFHDKFTSITTSHSAKLVSLQVEGEELLQQALKRGEIHLRAEQKAIRLEQKHRLRQLLGHLRNRQRARSGPK